MTTKDMVDAVVLDGRLGKITYSAIDTGVKTRRLVCLSCFLICAKKHPGSFDGLELMRREDVLDGEYCVDCDARIINIDR
jgi:hypothetical protein